MPPKWWIFHGYVSLEECLRVFCSQLATVFRHSALHQVQAIAVLDRTKVGWFSRRIYLLRCLSFEVGSLNGTPILVWEFELKANVIAIVWGIIVPISQCICFVGPVVQQKNLHPGNLMNNIYPGIPTTIKTMGVNITTVAYLRVLIIEIGSTIILMVVGSTWYVYIYISNMAIFNAGNAVSKKHHFFG